MGSYSEGERRRKVKNDMEGEGLQHSQRILEV